MSGNPYLKCRVKPELKKLIESQAKELGYQNTSDYIKFKLFESHNESQSEKLIKMKNNIRSVFDTMWDYLTQKQQEGLMSHSISLIIKEIMEWLK